MSDTNELDLIVRAGRVFCAVTGLDGPGAVGVRDGRIVAAGQDVGASASRTLDFPDDLLLPGLVDLHTHTYDQVTPLGIDADHYCLGRGVTTAVDTGSAGYDTLPGFRRFAVERSQTRLLAFLNISRIGLAIGRSTDGDEPGELEAMKLISSDKCVESIRDNEDILIGVKVRLSASIADNGRN
ncbi:MAG: hypothetical protein QF886_21865, partial [Planctomycetota bacterium]|nr:hypothetical protein [Planctomycetota bacterium]